jgi:hypothetical protein
MAKPRATVPSTHARIGLGRPFTLLAVGLMPVMARQHVRPTRTVKEAPSPARRVWQARVRRVGRSCARATLAFSASVAPPPPSPVPVGAQRRHHPFGQDLALTRTARRTACPVNTYSTSIGSTSCTACPAGYFTANAASTSALTCQPCARGLFSTGNGAACTACPLNTYSNNVGSAACTNCLPGTFTRAVGSNSSALCART